MGAYQSRAIRDYVVARQRNPQSLADRKDDDDDDDDGDDDKDDDGGGGGGGSNRGESDLVKKQEIYMKFSCTSAFTKIGKILDKKIGKKQAGCLLFPLWV